MEAGTQAIAWTWLEKEDQYQVLTLFKMLRVAHMLSKDVFTALASTESGLLAIPSTTPTLPAAKSTTWSGWVRIRVQSSIAQTKEATFH